MGDTVPAWWMKGAIIGACNCEWGCPCNFNAPPTYGHCDGFYTLVVKEGRYGELPLDGVTFIFGGHSPGPIHEGDGTSLLIVDEGTAPAQREAIIRLWRGSGVGSPFDEFASVTAVWHEPIVAPIEIELDGIRSTVRVTGDGTILDLALSRVSNPVTGDEEELFLDKPTGFTSLRSELGTSRVATLASSVMTTDVTGKYAEYAEFDYSGP